MKPNQKFFLTGCPSIDLAKIPDYNLAKEFFYATWFWSTSTEINDNYILILQHPVTTEFNNAKSQIEETIQAVKSFCKK